MKAVVIVFCLIPTLVLGLSPEYKSSMLGEFNYLLWRSPYHVSYLWGSSSLYDKHTSDCSGTFYAVAHRIGMPVQRTTAIEMEAGKSGWSSKRVFLDKAPEATLVWWTWPNSDRLHGHIGMLMISPTTGKMEVVHNNLSKGLHIEPIDGPLLDCMSSIKELTVGDKDTSLKLGPGVRLIK